MPPTGSFQAVAAAAVRLSGVEPACEQLGPPSGRRGAAPQGGADFSIIDGKRCCCIRFGGRFERTQVSRMILTQAAPHCATPAHPAKPAHPFAPMTCRPVAWQDDATTTKRELWSSWQYAPSRHCLGHGLGSGVRAGRSVTVGMAGAVACGDLGTGKTAAAVRPRIPALADRFMCFCRIA